MPPKKCKKKKKHPSG